MAKILQFPINDELSLALDEYETALGRARMEDPNLPQVWGKRNILPALLSLALETLPHKDVLRRAAGQPVKKGK